MAIDVCIFEDEKAVDLQPLTWTRPVWELRCGISTLEDKLLRYVDAERVFYICRDYLSDLIRSRSPDLYVNELLTSEACLFLNGRLLPDAKWIGQVLKERNTVWSNGEVVVAALLGGENLNRFSKAAGPLTRSSFDGLPTQTATATMITYPWDLVHQNAHQIERDFEFLGRGGVLEGTVYDGATLLDREHICIGPGATIKPGAVLDAESGPIYIAEGVVVMANAVIEGPCFVGRRSSIKIGAKIYEGTSIGEVCKVGGEVEESIIHSYSNKQHEGFLGHAYLGQWVNLGADTNNSDLKNNYSSVRVLLNGRSVDSGSLFVGLFMGDHSKTGINTMLNTGTVVGVMSNVFGAGYPPKYIPSFAWGGAEGLIEHQFDKALETARRVMARRKLELSRQEEKVLQEVYRRTMDERRGV